MSDTHTTRGGIGFFGLLTIVLIVLKLTGYAHYSWLVAFSPILTAIALGVIILGGLFLLYLAVEARK